jgi:hypothetical protein
MHDIVKQCLLTPVIIMRLCQLKLRSQFDLQMQKYGSTYHDMHKLVFTFSISSSLSIISVEVRGTIAGSPASD